MLATDELTWVQGWVPGRLGRAVPALCGGRPIAARQRAPLALPRSGLVSTYNRAIYSSYA